MPHDSAHRAVGPSAPSEVSTQQDSASSYSCSQCVLIFRTRFYLYEHLHQVHGLAIEAALRDSGLKTLPQSKPKPDIRAKTVKSDFAFNCKNCSFTSGNWSIFNEHKNQCSGSSNNETQIPKASILFKRQTSPTSTKEINSVKATHKTPSKDVKNYSKSPQTITKYFTAAPTVISDHRAKEKDAKALRLEGASVKSSGVFQMTATSIDMIENTKNATHLLNDLISDPTSAKPIDPLKEASLNNVSKRTSKESAKSVPSKKVKLETDQTNHTDTSNCAELSFEVSDDEEMRNLEEVDATQGYFCKHCDFSSASREHVYSHYEENHPYLRYNPLYIEEESDQSATFRCLECPVEFSSDVHLRNHYKEDHPDAPDIFNLKCADLNLVYKCFECPFTSSILHSLREHYKEKHPSHKEENPLLYCKYSSSEYNICDAEWRGSEEEASLEILDPERSGTPCPDERSPSLSPKPQHQTQDGTLYHCRKCTFNNKSVVVLHVHYKKCHPEEPITLDTIKQFVGAPSASEQNPDMEIDLSHIVVKEEGWESPISDPENSSFEQNSHPAPLTPEFDTSSSSNEKMFFCDRCDFSNSNVKSVVSHHNAKHGFKTTIEDILQYTSTLAIRNIVGVSNTASRVYPGAQELYYCQVCNYGNPSLKGLINHQNKIHVKALNKKNILEYTANIRDQIEQSQSHPTDFILPSGLPLPLITGKSGLFFCYLCNYRHKTAAMINRHFFKVHKGCRINTRQIFEHTSMIYERLQANGQLKSAGQNQDFVVAHLMEEQKKMTSPRASFSRPRADARLQCFHCPYSSHHVYLMRKHLITGHQDKMSFPDVLRLCETGAQFEPGFYCDVCTFRGGNAKEVKIHNMQRHCSRSLSIQFISTQLYLSHDMCDPQKRSNSLNDNDVADGISPQTYPEAYSCKACSFKGTSFSSITSHYLTHHPESVDEGDPALDGSDGSKPQSQSNTEQDYTDSRQGFDSYQMPLDFDNLNVSTAEKKEYSCSHCPATFGGHSGLIIHMGMKHRDMAGETPQLAKRMQIFKCSCCSYVNYIRNGVSSHANMKHPNKTWECESFYIGREHLHNVDMKVKNGNWKFCGYICKECSQIYSSKEKLNEHRKTHRQSPLNTVGVEHEAAKPIHDEIWCQHCGLFCASEKEHSDHLRVCPKNNTYPCALCADAFFSKVQLGIHYTKKHGEKAFFEHYAPLYNLPSEKNGQQIEGSVSQTITMYKCPSCRYVNSRHHGTLTHCQMRHPAVVVRADTLKSVEIDIANIIGHLPNSKTYGGFRCKKCPLIYYALKKLKKHSETDHSSRAGDTSELSAHAEQEQDPNMEPASLSSTQTNFVTKFRHFFKCSLCSYSSALLKSLGRHYRNRHGKSAYSKFYSPLFSQANKITKSPVKDEQTMKTENVFEKAEDSQERATPQMRVYKCNICSYGSPYRRYLIAHYRNRHKLETKAINKQMEKFKNWEATLPMGRFTCKKCQNVFFASKGRLLLHYAEVHSSEVVDFTITRDRTHRATGVYKCKLCKEKIFGIKNICRHLDQHRATMMNKEHEEKETETVEASEENPPPTLYPVEEEMKLDVRSVERMRSPSVSTASRSDIDVPEQLSDGRYICRRCRRTFMSLKGLRSHERSHVAFAALDNWQNSDVEEHIAQYIVYRKGTTRPYMCTLCPYRTTVPGLGKSHFLKMHRYALNSGKGSKHFGENTLQVNKAVDDLNADGDEEPENSFLEPPDVRRQLKHYNVMAQIDSAAKRRELQLSDPRMLPCEMCNFNSHHYSNMRRHYLKRHGKKLIRCKDCSFYTCFKQNLELHEQMGHSSVQSEPTHTKNLCCPFCLYQSKNKNNMIDHIVLHRDEHMMPIEVRRSKLSRCLQGVVFRCYKCTFTTGSADSLRSHMDKHNDLKPFKCRLCYFDCSHLRELEAHLCDKHQVIRNHQLVGHVSLDQLEDNEACHSRDEDDEYNEVLDDLQNDEQALKNEQGAGNPIKENMPLDFPRQNVDERFKDITDNTLQDENTNGSQAKAKDREEVSAKPAVPMEEENSEVPDKMVDDAAAVKSMSGSRSNSEARKAFSDYRRSKGKRRHEDQGEQQRLENSNPKAQNQANMSEEASPYGEMPILEKYFKEQQFIFTQHFENSEKCTKKREDSVEEGAGVGAGEDHEMQNPPVLLATDAAVRSPVAATMFSCDLCGRNLATSSELQRHMMRHGM